MYVCIWSLNKACAKTKMDALDLMDFMNLRQF